MKYIKNNPITFATLLTIFGAVYLFWFYRIDGIYTGKPYTYYYDTQNIPTEKQAYHIGDMVRIKVSFCKNRQAIGQTQWSLVDGKIIFFPKREGHELPVGCYPNGGGEAIFDLFRIPEGDYKEGEKLHFEGASTFTISGNRELKEFFRTQDFIIIP